MRRLEIILASRNVFRQGFRSLMPLLVVALACIVIIIISGFYEYIFQSLEDSVIRDDGHIWIVKDDTSQSLITAKRLEKINRIKGINITAPRADISGIIGFEDSSSLFSGRAVFPEKERQMKEYPSSIEESDKQNEIYEMKVGVLLAKGLGLSEGDWLSGISGFYGFSAKVEEMVQTESEERDRFFIEIPIGVLGDSDYSLVNSLHIQLTPEGDIIEVINDLKQIFEDDGIINFEVTEYTSPKSYISSVRTIYQDNLKFIIVVISITVLFAIATAFTLSLTERTQEIGTMRSFGTSKKHLFSLFQLEALLLSVYGFIIGLIAAIIAGFIINKLGGLEIPPPPTVEEAIHVGFIFHPLYMFISLVLVVVVGQISSLIVTRRIGHLSIMDQLNMKS